MQNWHAAEHKQLFSKPILRALLPSAERRGIDAHTLLKGTALFPSDSDCTNHRMSAQQWQQLYAQGQRLFQDDNWAQLQAEAIFHDRLSPLADTMQHAPNFQKGLRNFYRFRRQLSPLVAIYPTLTTKYLVLTILPHVADTSGALSVFTLGLIITLARQHQLPLHTWQLQLAQDIKSPSIWHEWLPQQITTAPLTRLSIPREQLVSQSRKRSPDAYQQALSFCRIQHDVTPAPLFAEWGFRWLHRRLHHRLHDGSEISINAMAAAAEVSPSTVKRLLKQHQLSYQQLVDQVRLFQLMNLLDKRHYNNFELAARLGYANQHNFRRACKRWLGVCPEVFRKSLERIA